MLDGMVLPTLLLLTASALWTATSPLETGPVCDQPPSSPQTDQTENLDHFESDWGVFCDLGTVAYEIANVTSPSLDGLAFECRLKGADPFAGLHCYRNLLSEPDSTFFRMQLDFRFSDTTCNNEGAPSIIQALEFTMNKWFGARRWEFALQWTNVGDGVDEGGQWRYWDGPTTTWLPLPSPVEMCLEGSRWYAFMLEGTISGDLVQYRRFSIDGVDYPLGITVPAVDSSLPDQLAIAVQSDANVTGDPYSLFIDRVRFDRSLFADSFESGDTSAWDVPDPARTPSGCR